MIDGIKLLNASVSVEELLRNPNLLFPLPVDETSGIILDQRRRYATVCGLTFALIPAINGKGGAAFGYRCELNGSLHKYHNSGLHNADDFTTVDLLAVLDDLFTVFGLNPFHSRLNGMEFGVNIRLPFPVADVLTRLISFKGVPFWSQEGGIYYQAETERYIVKVYDKGSQYQLPGNLLRVEVKVRKMKYLTNTKNIPLHTLADLLAVEHYPALGSLLSETFRTILFDEPLVTQNPPDGLKESDRELLLRGCNWRYWQRSKGLIGKEYDREQKRLKRDETRFRVLLDQHSPGGNWQNDIADLIDQKWQELTTVTPDLLAAIDDRLTVWQNSVNNKRVIRETPENCPLFTGLSESITDRETVDEETENVRYSPGYENSDLSVIHTLGLGGITDISPSDNDLELIGRGTLAEDVIKPVDQSTRQCPVTGYDISHQRANTRFVSTSTVRSLYDLDRQTFNELAGRFLTAKQAGTDLNKQCYHIAHNIRNAYTNPRNNPIRSLKKFLTVEEGQTLPLFPAVGTVRPTDRQLSALEHRKGTRWEIHL